MTVLRSLPPLPVRFPPLPPPSGFPAESAPGFLGVSDWKVLLTPVLVGAENMAIDEALLHYAAQTGNGVFRVYSWARPTLSFGRNQNARDSFSVDLVRGARIEVVRRITGGRALLHANEVTYSITAPTGRGDRPRAAYAAINQLLVRALTLLGVPVTVAGAAGRMPPPASAPCFELPAEGEILWEGKKLVGSAQYRDAGALLQHGSILIEDDQPRLRAVSTRDLGAIAAAGTLLAALGRAPGFDEVSRALEAALVGTTGNAAVPLHLEELDPLLLTRLRGRYASAEWTWGL